MFIVWKVWLLLFFQFERKKNPKIFYSFGISNVWHKAAIMKIFFILWSWFWKVCIFIIAFQNSKCSILILTSPYILGGNSASDHYSRFLMSCGLGYRKKPCLNETCESNCTSSGSGSSIHSAKKKWNTFFTVMTWRCLI